MNKTNHLNGKKFRVLTLGCRVNRYEAEAIASALEGRGASFVPEGNGKTGGGQVDILIVVTCSVTSVADAKTRKALRRCRRENPDSLIIACGCWAQAASNKEIISSGADIIVGNRIKEHLTREIERWYDSPGTVSVNRIDLRECREWDCLSLDRPRMGTRAFLKVQEGCDRRCSYCAVPSLRGTPVSRNMDDAISEAARIAENGVREIILTGVQLGGYCCDGATLAGLTAQISRVPGVKRLRFGSLEPFSVTEDLLAAMRDSEAFCPHLHLPLQSGDDGVLRAMRRGYAATDFAKIVEMTRKYLGEDAHISTDLIVGFPGEDEDAFARSMSLIESLALGRVHIFPHSPRAGAESAAMPPEPPALVRNRISRVRELADELLSRYAASMVGKTHSVLAEDVGCGVASGWSRHYLRVYFPPPNTENNLQGKEFSVHPKISVGGMLLCEGIDRESVMRNCRNMEDL